MILWAQSRTNPRTRTRGMLARTRALCSGWTNVASKFTQRCNSDGVGRVFLWENVISEDEEKTLMTKINSVMLRRRYESSHWDKVIHDYREMERGIEWFAGPCFDIIARVQEMVISGAEKEGVVNPCKLNPQIHVLDYSPTGLLGAHVDHTSYCGKFISCLTLLSPRLVRYRPVAETTHDTTKHHHQNNDCQSSQQSIQQYVELLTPPRSLYLVCDDLRFGWTHEIGSKETQVFAGKQIELSRRVAVMFRDEVVNSTTNAKHC